MATELEALADHIEAVADAIEDAESDKKELTWKQSLELAKDEYMELLGVSPDWEELMDYMKSKSKSAKTEDKEKPNEANEDEQGGEGDGLVVKEEKAPKGSKMKLWWWCR